LNLGPLSSKEDVEEALMFIEIAKRDLEASKLLLENGYYSQGLFYLQQSIEKAIKAMLRALNLLDTKSLRKGMGHEVLIKGLKAISYAGLDKLKDLSLSILVKGFLPLYQLSMLCPEAYKYLFELMESTTKGVETIDKWLNDRYDKELRDKIVKLGGIIFTENADAKKKVEEFLDAVSKYVTDIAEAFKEFELEAIVTSYWRFEKAMFKCFERLPAEYRDQPKKVLEIASAHFVDQIARVFYVIDVLVVLTSYHVLFEDRTSMLRYPDKGWTPLSISEGSVIVRASKKIIDFTSQQELLDVLSDFIKGEIKREKSRAVYEKIVNYIRGLRETA